MRCLALAQVWQDAGGTAAFLMAQSTPAIRARLAAENCEVLTFSILPGSVEDAVATNKCAQDNDAEWVLIDGYSFGSEYQEQLQSGGRKLLCIDDRGDCEYYAVDIVLNQNPNASEKLYRCCSAGTRLLLGTDYCLLRREFAVWRDWQREISATGRTILVTLGGSTPADIGVRLMESVSNVNIDGLSVVFVVGGSTPDSAPLENCATRFPEKISIRRDVSNIAKLMAEADIAISAAGSTCWELCLLGLPSVLLDLADNQTPVAMELERRGCALHAGNGDSFSSDGLAKSVEKLLASRNRRELLSRRSRQLVDGFGAERVVSAMRGGTDHALVAGTRGARA
jgi:UDP-2,4-diacetamido-2,4,6-trideoxy-beta-L-altropyranose hydrolase